MDIVYVLAIGALYALTHWITAAIARLADSA